MKEIKLASSRIIDNYTKLRSKNDYKELCFEERMNLADELLYDLKSKDHYMYRIVVDEVVKNSTINQMINFASNDYLSFKDNPQIIREVNYANFKFGVGAGSVPMFSGTFSVHQKLEEKLAKFVGSESAIVFNSGFSANYGILSALLTSDDIAILDTYVHASIIDGCQHTNVSYFLHNDPESLERTLIKNKKYKNKIVVIEGVYSMDGDLVNLDEIILIGRKHGAIIMIDESHSIGVVGEKGRGAQYLKEASERADIVTGSLGKALGGIGGFVAGSQKLINLLEITSRTFIYSTSIPPSSAAGLIKAIELLENSDDSLKNLWRNIEYFKNKMSKIYEVHSDSAVIPFLIKNDEKLLNLCQKLLSDGIFVNPVFFPVVPKRKSRIRISINAGLKTDEIDYFIDRIKYHLKM